MPNNVLTWVATFYIIWDCINTLLTNFPPVAESSCNLAEVIPPSAPECVWEIIKVPMGSK